MNKKESYIIIVIILVVSIFFSVILIYTNNRYDNIQDNETVQTSSSDEVLSEESSTVEETEVSSTSPSSSEPIEESFDPATYPTVDFNEWNHDKLELASKVQVTGTVVQAMKSDVGMNLRLAINDDYDQVILITIEDSDYEEVIAEDDNVTVYGLNAGLSTYETVMGNEQTIPSMVGTNYTVNSYGQ